MSRLSQIAFIAIRECFSPSASKNRILSAVCGLSVMLALHGHASGQQRTTANTAKPRNSSNSKLATSPQPQPPNAGTSSRSNNSTRTARKATEAVIHADATLEDGSEEPPVIVQAGCKNCQSTTSVSEHQLDVPETTEGTVYHDDSAAMWSGDEAFGSCDGAACDGYNQPILFGLAGCGIQWQCDPCSPLAALSRRLYWRAEAATFWGSGQFLPTLVTTSVGNPLPPVEEAGLINDPDTRSLFGGGEVSEDAVVGFRFEAGLWADDYKGSGLLFRMFDTGENDVGLSTDNTRTAVIARNFLDVGPPREQSLVSIAYPGQTTGSIQANLSSRSYGGDILYRSNICRDSLGRWDWIGGFQTARLDESLDITSRSNDLNAPNPTLDQEDHFRARNHFHGGTLGIHGEVRDGCWYFSSLFKLGIGGMERRIDISGQSTTTVGADSATQNQGLLARSTNIGSFRDGTSVVVPEFNLVAGYRLTRKLDFTVGYNLLRLPKVGRVVSALDRELASNLSDPLTGEVRPSFAFRESNLTLHSLNFGLQWNY